MGERVGGMDSQGSKVRICHHLFLTARLFRELGREPRPLNAWGFSGKDIQQYASESSGIWRAHSRKKRLLGWESPGKTASSYYGFVPCIPVNLHVHAWTHTHIHTRTHTLTTGSAAALGLYLTTTWGMLCGLSFSNETGPPPMKGPRTMGVPEALLFPLEFSGKGNSGNVHFWVCRKHLCWKSSHEGAEPRLESWVQEQVSSWLFPRQLQLLGV